MVDTKHGTFPEQLRVLMFTASLQITCGTTVVFGVQMLHINPIATEEK